MSEVLHPVITRPRIRITNPPKPQKGKKAKESPSPISLTDYRFDLEIRGLICLVSVTARFHNSLAREMEGELEFPLPEGVSISGFALDINGEMVDASCVTKEKGRVVYETEKRKRVDPGLAEHVEGNIFRTKIYPLPANGSRTVRIDWVQTVRWDAQKDVAVFRLPVFFDQPVDKFELNVNLVKSKIIPKCKDVSIDLSNQLVNTFKKTSDGWKSHQEWENFQPDSDLFIEIPGMKLDVHQVEQTDDGTYCIFVVQKKLLDPKNWPWSNKDQIENKVPESDFATIYWDASASARPANVGKNRQLDFLKRWIRQSNVRGIQIVPVRNEIDMDEVKTFFLLDSTAPKASSPKQEVQFKSRNNDGKIFRAVYLYDCGTVMEICKLPSKSKQTSNGNGQNANESSQSVNCDWNSWSFDMTFSSRKAMADKIIETLEDLPYDGSSRMDCVTEFQKSDKYVYSPFCGLKSRSLSLLFSDGMAAPSDPAPRILHVGSMFTFSTGVKSNAPLLRQWATINKGLYINLNDLGTQQAVEQFMKFQSQPWNQYSVSGDDADVYPKTIYDDDQPFAFCFCKVKNENAGINISVDSVSQISCGINIPKECFDGVDVDCDEDEDDSVPSKGSKKYDLEDLPEIWTDCSRNREFPIRVLYAQAKLDELMGDPNRNSDKIRKLGQRYSLVTPETSLIVLESLDQYILYNICPPRSQPSMQTDFFEYHLKTEDDDKKEFRQRKKDRLERVKKMWRNRVEWWEKEWPKPPFEKEDDSSDSDVNADSGNSRPPRLIHNSTNTGVNAHSGGGFRALFTTGNRPARRHRLFHDSARLFRSDNDLDISEFSFESGPEDGFDSFREDMTSCYLVDPDHETGPGSRLEQLFGSSAEALGLTGNTVSVHVKRWESDSKYLEVLNASSSIDEAYPAYLELCDQYGSAPSFYLECAHWFYSHNAKVLALRVLSNLEELNLEDPQLLRALGHRLELWGEQEDAIRVYRRVKKMRPEEPQSYRDLALVLAKKADALESKKNNSKKEEKETKKQRLLLYSNALSLLEKTILGRRYKDWDWSYPEIEVIALEEFNAILDKAKKLGGRAPSGFPKELITLLDFDIRIVMTWHAANTDIDLHVIEPTNEIAYYGYRLTKIGGLVSRDFRNGYGPEEYLIRRAIPGKYVVKAHYFGSSAVEILGEVCVQADIFTNFGRPNQTVQSLDFSLKDKGDDRIMGEIEFKE
ncbi:MAG: DUF2135 domain-containing protein [Thermoguttaceae bacterium]|nr:DUF2135 domain-containing protein [Thermoguttaceae bacterium]